MRDLLKGRLHYNVRTDAPEGTQATSCTSLERFAEMLPHGSGFDSSWTIYPRRKGFTLYTEWHAMNADGYYCGYWPVRVVVNRLVGGNLELGSVRVNARGTNDAGDYIADVLADVIREANPSARLASAAPL